MTNFDDIKPAMGQRVTRSRKVKYFLKYVLPYPKKIANYAKLKYAIKFKKLETRFYPIKLGVETANKCNLKCPLCVRARELLKRPAGIMKFENYKKVIDEIGDYLIQVRLHGWGEPFLNPDLPKMIAYAHSNGIFTNFHTNGHFLTEDNVNAMIDSGLDEISIAMDGMTQKTYEKYRAGGDLNTVKEGVKKLCRIKRERGAKNPHIILQFLVMKHNEHEIPEIKKFAKEAGVDQLFLKTVNIMLVEDKYSKDFIPKNNENRRYNLNGENVKFKKQYPCTAVCSEIKMNWDGTITTCTCDDTHGGYVKGNLFKDDIKNIIFSKNYTEVKRKSLDKSFEMCKKCEGHQSSI